MTPDGSLIVGRSGLNNESIPFVWSEESGMEDFQQVLIDQHGLGDALEGWNLGAIQSVSSNGQFFAGWSLATHNPPGKPAAWLVRLDAPWTHAQPLTFNDPTPTTDDRFGRSMALDGNYVLIGALGDDTFGEGVGQSHLFDAVTGNLLLTFNDPTPTSVESSDGDRFGWSVALDGNNILIGAHVDDTNGVDVGQAHLFTIAPGDFDADGDTDGNDFLTWQRGESPADIEYVAERVTELASN